MAEQPQPQPKQEQSRSWLAILGEAQLQNAEAQVAAGKYVAEVVGEATSGAGTAVVEDYSLGIMSKEYASNHPKARKTGELIGHLITTVAGVLEIGAAATEAVFGGVVTSTGALAPIGVGAIVQSTVVGTHGAGVTFIGGSNSVKSAKDIYQMFKSEGTPGRASSKTSADSIRKNLNNEILDEMEAKGGHLLEKHVGKTNEELLKRAAQEGVPSTTFSNKSTALKATQENIRKNADQISDWLDNPNSKGYLITKTEHNYPVGKGVDVKDGGNSASKKVNNNLSKSQLYLVKDPSMTSGYRIITGYPVFD
ncbi:RNase A-like domain-containing protein [Paenibacillus azoreducens]|uniref:RNase A-like domain-containing protein n=1 Tax=Paenibacillus azoreducens TaxID=116718 RepID=UPI0039F56746